MADQTRKQSNAPAQARRKKLDLYAVPRRVLAGLLTWAWPGTGHLLLGQRKRGTVLACGIGAIYIAGLFIGGVTVANPAFESGPNSQQFLYWFQFFMLPNSILVAWENNILNQIGGIANLLPNTDPTFTPSYGRVREIGVLYLALAGLLNLLAIVDVILSNRDTDTPHTDTPRTNAPHATNTPPA